MVKGYKTMRAQAQARTFPRLSGLGSPENKAHPKKHSRVFLGHLGCYLAVPFNFCGEEVFSRQPATHFPRDFSSHFFGRPILVVNNKF